MKPLISMILVMFAAVSVYAPVQAATTTVTKTKIVYVCPKKKAHHKKYKRYVTTKRTFYAPGYCKNTCCNGCVRQTCCPGYTYTCRTDYYYRSGHNMARVETCD